MRRKVSVAAATLAVVLGFPMLAHAFLTGTKVVTFTKSVGLDPDCAPPSQVGLTVAPGTNVTYCYVIYSAPGVTLTLEELDDDQLGTLFPPPAPLVLTPTFHYTVTKTVPIFRTTLNVATWTVDVTTGIDDPIEVVASNQVRVSVPSTAKAPTLSGMGLALVAFALLLVGAIQLSFGRRGARQS